MTVAPKISGRVERLECDLGDAVERGQVVARLDDDEFVQAIAVARAELAVARASSGQAEAAAEAAARELERVAALRARGILSEAQLDQARVESQAKRAQKDMAAAQIERAKAALQTARIQLSYTRVSARWTGGSDQRVVSERFVEVGDNVSANAPLFAVIELTPIRGAVFVTEADYVHLAPGQPVSLATDAYPGETFTGRVDRVAPVFRQDSRQARVELLVENEERRLKPGMFVRATVVLTRLANAMTVPEAALTQRDETTGVFVVEGSGDQVRWRPVVVGIRSAGRVQVKGAGLRGRVVTLGQQLIEDGAAISITGTSNAPDEPRTDTSGP